MNKVNIFLRHLKEKNICLSTNVPSHLKNSKLGLKLTIILRIIKLCILWVRVMVFNATFNNISVISWWSVLLVEETGENH